MGTAFTIECPKCGRKVERVDGEYGRHRSRNELCPMSRREIKERKSIFGRTNGRH